MKYFDKVFEIVNAATLIDLNFTIPEAYNLLNINKHAINTWSRANYGVSAGKLMQQLNRGKTIDPLFWPKVVSYHSIKGINGDLILEHITSSVGVKHLYIRNDTFMLDDQGTGHVLLGSRQKGISCRVTATFDSDILMGPMPFAAPYQELYDSSILGTTNEIHSVLVKYAETKK